MQGNVNVLKLEPVGDLARRGKLKRKPVCALRVHGRQDLPDIGIRKGVVEATECRRYWPLAWA